MKVVYWNNIPAPYMVDRFNAVARRQNLDLEVWFSARTEPDRSWTVDECSWQFRHRYLRAARVNGASVALVPIMSGTAPDVFVSLYAGTPFLVGSALARMKGARTAFWVEVTYDAWVRRRWWKEALKRHVLPRADAILTAGEDGRSFALRYGAQPARIFSVPHVIDASRYATGSAMEPSKRDRLRRDLGLRGVTFIYVGRLWEGKGLLFLLEAFAALQRQALDEMSLLLVGDGPQELELRTYCEENGLKNVVFCGFREGDMLPRLYGAADVFVFPTLGDPFGLVVLEAMACGLPIISTTATGEIAERVQESVNGFIVAPASTKQLLDRMRLLAGDVKLRESMGRASADRVAGQSPEMWAEAFECAVDEIVSLPKLNGFEARRPPDVHGVDTGAN